MLIYLELFAISPACLGLLYLAQVQWQHRKKNK